MPEIQLGIMDNKSVINFLIKRFPDEVSAVDYFTKARWGHKPACPYGCRSKVYDISNRVQPYKCSLCRRQFSVRTGTIMEGSKLDIRIWLLAIWILGHSKKGVSSLALAATLGITQKSAWYLSHRIRAACIASGQVSGVVEVDEAFIGGKEANKHANKKTHTRTSNKTAVVGVVERGGRIKAQVAEANKTAVWRFIRKNIKPGSTIYSDDSPIYRGLDKVGYQHQSVNHSAGEYVRGEVSTNSIESFWAVFKRAYKGTYHHLSEKHLQRYLDEFTSRRVAADFMGGVCQSNARRVSYKQLTYGPKN